MTMRNRLSSGNKKHTGMLEPDEIFIDAKNLPSFDRAHMEGRIERPLSPNAFRGLLILAIILATLYIGQTINLTVFQHDTPPRATIGAPNQLSKIIPPMMRGTHPYLNVARTTPIHINNHHGMSTIPTNHMTTTIGIMVLYVRATEL